MRFALKSRCVVTASGEEPGIVVVEDGKIVQIAPYDAPIEAEDLSELALMPGVVDSHVHLNEPGRVEWEGFETGTRAAAAGGVTTLVDMPLNSSPVTTTTAAFQAKLDATHGKLWCDVGFYSGVVPGNARDLAQLADMGALGAKAFMVHSGIDEFPASDESTLREAMKVLASVGQPLLVHAEVELDADEFGDDPTHYENFMNTRPPRWEEAAIELLVNLCRETGCHVHIVHLAAATAVPMLAAARAEGLPITVESCPQYLLIEADGIDDGHCEFKCCPPIRDGANREGLWRALADGVIDLVVTDHSPATADLKRLNDGNFMEAWGGIASLGLALQLMWREVSARGYDLSQLARWMATEPARLAGLDRKGAIEVGRDADFVVFDPTADDVVRDEHLHFRNRLTPYLGRPTLGRIERTYVRGKLVYSAISGHGEPVGAPLLHRG